MKLYKSLDRTRSKQSATLSEVQLRLDANFSPTNFFLLKTRPSSLRNHIAWRRWRRRLIVNGSAKLALMNRCSRRTVNWQHSQSITLVHVKTIDSWRCSKYRETELGTGLIEDVGVKNGTEEFSSVKTLVKSTPSKLICGWFMAFIGRVSLPPTQNYLIMWLFLILQPKASWQSGGIRRHRVRSAFNEGILHELWMHGYFPLWGSTGENAARMIDWLAWAEPGAGRTWLPAPNPTAQYAAVWSH